MYRLIDGERDIKNVRKVVDNLFMLNRLRHSFSLSVGVKYHHFNSERGLWNTSIYVPKLHLVMSHQFWRELRDLFISITTRPTLIGSLDSWSSKIYGSNRSISIMKWKFEEFYRIYIYIYIYICAIKPNQTKP